MGCDTASDHNGTALYTRLGKIGGFKTTDGETVLIGGAGHAAIIPTLQRRLTIDGSPREQDEIGAEGWASAVAEAITGVLADANPPLLSPAGEHAACLDGILLMAWRQYLWVVQTHSAIRPHDGIAAIGSGRDIALGAMHTALDYEAQPYDAVHSAVRWAAQFDSGCGIDDRGPMLCTTDWAE
ncbi:hypothetical protein C8259_09040 [Nocardia nova]|uniref:Uncharacterized protein n=2 Tax=Nocardiaceae TaxID=85025 RepID=A0A2T2Z8A2_9NOCA|nr:hypothetical protein C8259_09040 [Nocardia nova]